jgi:hypothetical protein
MRASKRGKKRVTHYLNGLLPILNDLWSKSPTFYEQLLSQWSFAKQFQSQAVRKKLCKTLLCKTTACKIW